MDDSFVFKAMGVGGRVGSVGVVGGCGIYHGAPVLASLAAYRIGARVVYAAVPRSISDSVRASSPELLVIPLPDEKLTRGCATRLLKWMPTVDSLAVGVGMKRQRLEGLLLLVREARRRGMRLVLEGSAILPEVIGSAEGSIVITDGSGFRALFGAEAELEAVRKAAKEHSITILLVKGCAVASDGERTSICRPWNPGMDVWGIGSVLAGVAAAMLSRSDDPFLAASSAPYVLGLAGELAYERKGLHLLATDLIERLPDALRRFDRVVEGRR